MEKSPVKHKFFKELKQTTLKAESPEAAPLRRSKGTTPPPSNTKEPQNSVGGLTDATKPTTVAAQTTQKNIIVPFKHVSIEEIRSQDEKTKQEKKAAAELQA